MNFYSNKNLPAGSRREVVFRVWPVPKILAVIIFSSLGVSLIYLGSQGGFQTNKVNFNTGACYWTGGTLMFFAWMALHFARDSLGPDNWLMKANPDRLLIKYRSYHNAHFSKEDIVVVEIPVGDVEWIREVQEAMASPKPRTPDSNTTFLDLKLSPKLDLLQIKEALDLERKRKAPRKGLTSSMVLHYPVQYVEPGVLRLEWNGIRPNAQKALRILRMQFSLNTTENFHAKHWDQLEGKELEDRILDLTQRGRILEATTLAKLKFNMTTTEAVNFVDELLGKPSK